MTEPLRYCTRCILPNTRPGIVLDRQGVCSACRGHDLKEGGIDWAGRAREFDTIVAAAKARSTGYDCIVPVSGGKDSWYQVSTARDHGLKVLAVTWRTPARTAVGQRNLDALIGRLGVDHMDVTIDPDVERRFMVAAYERRGATGLPMHMALFRIPIRLAECLRIPLVLWGENPQLEFGGTPDEQLATRLDGKWLERHGCMQGTRPEDWIGIDGLTPQDLVAYALPSEMAFSPDAVFLGAFFKWNSFHNAEVARRLGFEDDDRHLKVGVWSFADIDCEFISLHHLLKWYKFGITRAFDNLSVQIRHGLTTRAEAIEQLRVLGSQIPHDDIARFCAFAGKSEGWFWEVAERFRNPAIWRCDAGVWRIENFLIADWPWA